MSTSLLASPPYVGEPPPPGSTLPSMSSTTSTTEAKSPIDFLEKTGLDLLAIGRIAIAIAIIGLVVVIVAYRRQKGYRPLRLI